MGSGQFPNLVLATKTDMVNWANNGMIIPVDEYVTKYMPNLKNYLSEEDMKNGKYLGKQYLIPTPLSSLQNPLVTYIRKDWLDKLKLPVPQTTDELMNVMKAFASQDPDGNGKKDTFGFASQKNLIFMDSTLALSFGVNLDTQNKNINWHRVNGKLLPDIVAPGAKDALAYFREMYASGVYDKESLVLDYNKLEEKLTSGKYGAATFYDSAMRGRINNNIKKADPNGQFIVLAPPKGPRGEQGVPRGDNVGNLFAVTKGTTPDQAAALAKLLNWFMEKDTSVTYNRTLGDALNMGVLGANSELLGGKFLAEMPASKATEEAKADNYRFSYRLLYSSTHMLPDENMIEFGKLSDETKPGTSDDMKVQSQYGVKNALKIAGPKASQYLPDLITYFDEIKMKIVTGSEPLETFDKWVDYFYKNHGQEVIDEANSMNN
ncbi:extracellular solute-binding protein [Paenibacillus sp. CC-CFT747]|nr:extracellular solute-binding protein [Paenibacillus sp. CC-CFT747]